MQACYGDAMGRNVKRKPKGPGGGQFTANPTPDAPEVEDLTFADTEHPAGAYRVHPVDYECVEKCVEAVNSIDGSAMSEEEYVKEINDAFFLTTRGNLVPGDGLIGGDWALQLGYHDHSDREKVVRDAAVMVCLEKNEALRSCDLFYESNEIPTNLSPQDFAEYSRSISEIALDNGPYERYIVNHYV